MKNEILTAAAFALATSSLSLATTSLAQEAAPMGEEAIAALARMNFSAGPVVSPDGERMAYISNASGLPQVWVKDLRSGDTTQVTDYQDPVGSVRWSPTEDKIAYLVSPGGGLNSQVYVSNADGSAAKRLTLGRNDNNALGEWTRDGKYLTINTNRDNPAARDAGLLDAETGQWIPLVSGKGLNYIVDVKGRKALIARLIGRGDVNLYLVDMDSRDEVLLTPHEGKAETAGAFFSQDGKTVYLISNVDRDRHAVGKISLEGDRPGRIEYIAERADAVADGGAISDDGRRAAIVWNVGGRSEVELLDLETGFRKPLGSMGLDGMGGFQFSGNGETLYFSGSAANRTTDIYAIGWTADEPQRLTKSAHEGVDLNQLVQPELLTYTSFDGLELSGWLYRPAGVSEPMPMVFVYHGGPEGQARPSSSAYYQSIVTSGIAVFAPNVRGSSGYGKAFMAMDDRAKRFDGVRDIDATTKAMVDAGIADPDRLAIMGGSYGGYMVMAGVTEFPDMFAAGINLFGIVNFESFFRETEPWMAAISTTEYGDPNTEADLLRRLSPIHKLDQVTTPLFVLHGANDTNVPVVEAEQIVESLEQRGVEVKYTLFPDEGHGWRKEPNRVRSTLETVEFLQEHLLK